MSEAKKKKKVIAAIKMKKGAAKRVNKASVRGKQVYFTAAANEMLFSGISALQEGVREMQAGIKEQMNKHKESVRIMQAGIMEQMNKNKKAVRNMQAGIAAQVKATQEYTKMFYG